MSKLGEGMKSVIQQRQAGDQATNRPVTHMTGRSKSKSASPDYTRITVYIRRETDDRLRQRLLDEGRREMSDLLQQLLDDYLGEK